MHRSRAGALAAGAMASWLLGCGAPPAPLQTADVSAQSGGCKAQEVEPAVEMRTDGASSTASLRGRVSNALTYQPIADIIVTLSGPHCEWIVVSDGSGEFRFPNVPPGDGYVLRADNGDYRPLARGGIRLKPGQKLFVSTPLIPSGAEMPEISTLPNPPYIDVWSSTRKESFDQDFWRRVPLVR